jgi:NCS1 family nucleobase:cation symporter-1
MATQAREPTVEEEQQHGLLGQIEVHSIDWIPDTERHGKTWQQAMLWFLGNFQYFTIPIGFVGPALGLSLGWSILAGALGIWFGTLFMAFHATQGPVFGLPQMIQTRAQMGYRGVVVALFAVLFTYMAFNVADQVLMSTGLHGAFGWNAHLVAAGTAVLAALLAIFGYDWVHRVFRFLLVISFPCYAIISIAILIGHAGGHAPHHSGFLFVAFMAQFSVAAAYNITYAPYVSDYSRYMPRKTPARGIITAVFFGASTSAIWLIALGAWLATRLNISDGLVGLQIVGDNVVAPLGSITAVLSATALLATMGMNAYGGMLTVLTGIDCFKTIKTSRMLRVVTVIALAIVWYAIGASLSSSTSAVSAVLNSLTLMLYLLVPWTALNLVDFFFVRRGHYAITDIFRPDGVYGAWGWRGLTAYFVGFAAEIPFMNLPPIAGLSYKGYFPAHVTNGVDYAWLVGLVVSGLVYLILSRSLNLAAEQSAIDASERELQAIDVAEAAAIAEEGHPDGQAPEPALSRGRGADQQLARGAAGRQIAQRPGRLGQETAARPSTPGQARR